MPAPSQLSIATSACTRLVKEEASYRKEYTSQQARITKLESESETSTDENAEYTLRQERKALEETAAMFPNLRQKIEEAKARLEAQLAKDKGADGQTSPEDITKAEQAIAAAEAAMQDAS